MDAVEAPIPHEQKQKPAKIPRKLIFIIWNRKRKTKQNQNKNDGKESLRQRYKNRKFLFHGKSMMIEL